MNLNITYLIFFLFTSIIVPVNNTIAPSSNKFNSSELILTDEYFPILTNKILIYDSDFGDTELKISKNKNLNVFSLESEDFIYRQKLLIDQNGVFVKETYQKINVLFGLTKEGTLTYNEPLPRIKFPFEAGKKWNWKGKEFDDDDTYILDLNSRIDNIEKVTVPAGTFDAIKLVTSVKSTKGTKSNVTEWYAKDVGLIKMIAIVEGGGIIGAARDLLGLGEIVFELKEVKSK